MSYNFYWVKPVVNAVTPSEGNGYARVFVLLVFFVTSVAVFGSLMRFLPLKSSSISTEVPMLAASWKTLTPSASLIVA
jgi:hypothetical protein